jgi:hypothetical protein
MGPWSKLERRLRDVPDPALDLRFRFTAYRQDVIETPHWSEAACKFWITQGRRTLWVVPRDRHAGETDGDIGVYGRRSPGWLVELGVEYLKLPRTRLIDWQPEWAGWGLVDILKASDRRIGRRQWKRLRDRLNEPVALRLLDQRSGKPPSGRLPVGGRDSDRLHDPD